MSWKICLVIDLSGYIDCRIEPGTSLTLILMGIHIPGGDQAHFVKSSSFLLKGAAAGASLRRLWVPSYEG